MSQIKAIISDSDGTLLNTIYLISHGQFEAAVTYLTNLGIPKEDIPVFEKYETYIKRTVGGNTKDTFEKTFRLLFNQQQTQYLEKVDFDKLDQSLTSFQDHIAPLYVHPFHGLTELFSWTGENKISFGIFTSGNRRMIVRNFGVSLPVLGYEDLFRSDDIDIDKRLHAFITRAEAVYGMPKLAVVTCEDIVHTKPDPEGILKLMKELNLKPEEVVVLGDLPVDIQAAKAAGVQAIGISHGFGTVDDLKKAGAIRIIDDLDSLPKLIETHNKGETSLF